MDFSTILAWVEGLLDSLWSTVVSLLDAIVQWVSQIAGFIWDSLVAVWNWLSGIWSALKDFFDDLWWEVITPFIEWAQQIIDDITTWLADFLDPLLTFIQRVLDWYTHVIYPIIKDVLEVLQRVRLILALFKILGVKWAAKLDADIQRLQGYLTLGLQDVIKTLNTLSTIIAVILDPAQIIRKDFFTGTLFSSLGAVKRAAAFGSSRALTPTEAASETNNKAMLNGGAAVLTRNADGSVAYSDAAARTNAALSDAVNYYGFPTQTP